MAAEWTVHPHGPVEHIAENLWRVTGSLPRMSLARTMTVAKKSDGSLVVHSGIALEDRAMEEIERLGPLEHLLVPNAYHRLDAPKYAERYPKIRIYAPKGSRAGVQKKVRVDATYDEFPNDAAVHVESLAGTNDQEGAMIVRSKDGTTLVLNDAVFNMDPQRGIAWLFTSVMGSAPGPRVSRIAKLALVKDQPAFFAALHRYAAIPDLTRLIVAHDKMTSGPEAAKALREAATYVKSH